MNYYEKIRTIRNEMFPPKLEFGCEVISKMWGLRVILNKSPRQKITMTKEEDFDTYHCTGIDGNGDCFVPESELRPLGKPVSLQDILLITEKKLYPNYLEVNSIGELSGDVEICEIDFTKSIKDQREEALKAIYNLIK